VSTDAILSQELRRIIDAALSGVLTPALAARAVELGPESASAVMLAASRRIAELNPAGAPASGPHTPSGALPPYAKPQRRKGGKPGARAGHTGHRRPTPPPDHRVEVAPLKVCPDCQGEVLPPRRRRRRTVEDMPADVKIEATEYSIPQHWCPCCRKHVEPAIDAALPNASIGNGLVALTTVFHYGLGLTIDQTRQVLLSPLRTHISAGGLADLWRRAAEVFLPWYEQIGREARASATLHADETGWRVNGETHWLWCFCNHQNCYYMIEESRGSAALRVFFTEAFRGVLIHDFWGPYGWVEMEQAGDHQCCLVHLLRELDHVDHDKRPKKTPEQAAAWDAFAKMLRRLVRDGIRLRKRPGYAPADHSSRIARIDARLRALIGGTHDDPDASRIVKRLHHFQDQLFTFLDRPEANWENNFAERQIRPAVILRKNSQCNRSERGAATQAVMMTIYRTLRLRGHDARAVMDQSLRVYSATGKLPPLPAAVAHG
jgi:transposase